MGIHITQIGKHKFVCGLFWQALSRPRELAREAKELARKIDSDLMLLRVDHTAAQAGFAHSRDGVRKGMYSLAAVVSKTLATEGAWFDGERQPVHNWLGAFKLPDGAWAYFAVRDASFLPNGDFAGSREEVLERLQSDYGLGGWNAVIGDEELEEFGFHNFNPRTIESMIPRRKDGSIKVYKWWALQPVKRTIPWRHGLIATILLLVAAATFHAWNLHQRRQQQLQLEKAIEAARLEAMGKAAPAAIPPPWNAKPKPVDLARACVERFGHLSPGGWTLASYECTASTATHTWNRGESAVAYLLELVPEAQLEESGDKGRHVQQINVPVQEGEALLEARQLLPRLYSTLQMLNLQFRLSPLPPPVQTPGKSGEPPPYWNSYALSLTAHGIAPLELAKMLDLPGMRIEKLVYAAGAWSVEGVMYAK